MTILRQKTNSKKLFVLLAGFLLIGSAGCAGARRPPPVRSHPAPDLQVETGVFQQAGCPMDDSGRAICPADSPIGMLGCSYIADPGEYLGGLDPTYPLNICWVLGRPGQPLPKGSYLYRHGCLLPQYAWYVVFRDGQFELIATLDDLKKTYAPITSENEAISFAMAATGLSAYFDFEALPGYRYFVSQLEDTHAAATDNGYLVYLYDYKLCGCGPHTTSYVEILVTSDGSMSETGRTPVFEDPEQDSLCVD